MQKLQNPIDLRFCVVASPTPSGFFAEWHRHPFYEIGFVLEGECDWEMKRRPSARLIAGDAIVIPPDCEHREATKSRVQLAWTGFSHPDFHRFAPRSRVIKLGDSAGAILFLLKHLYREQQARQERSEEICDLALRHLLIIIQRAATHRVVRGKTEPLNARQSQVVQAVAAYLDRNADRPLSLKQVAQYHNLSAPHLSLLFRKHYRTTPTAYRLRKRFEMAKRMLGSAGRSIKEVAAACGYADAAHFCREFKRIEGTTPGRAL